MSAKPDQKNTTLTPDDIAMAGITLGDASKGDMVAFDGEMECAGCNTAIESGAAVFWRCSSEMECDPYCGACVIREAAYIREFCAAIESGKVRP